MTAADMRKGLLLLHIIAITYICFPFSLSLFFLLSLPSSLSLPSFSSHFLNFIFLLLFFTLPHYSHTLIYMLLSSFFSTTTFYTSSSPSMIRESRRGVTIAVLDGAVNPNISRTQGCEHSGSNALCVKSFRPPRIAVAYGTISVAQILVSPRVCGERPTRRFHTYTIPLFHGDVELHASDDG